MLVLIAMFCLVDNPSKCEEKMFFFEEAAHTPQQCILYGQPHIAKYIVEHPQYNIAKFKCVRNQEQGI